jgi:uncharacterized repeat protein (TIGR01451 family)
MKGRLPMKVRKTRNVRIGRKGLLSVSQVFVLVFALVVNFLPVAQLAQPALAAPPGYVELGGYITNNYQVWEPSTSSWIPGNAAGYSEGDTAAFSPEISGIPAGYYYFTACFNYIGANGAYAFIDLEPYNTTETVTPRGGTIGSSTLGVATDNAAAIVTYVTPVGVGLAPCANNDIGYEIGLQITASIATNWYIYYGSHLAAPGDITEWGATVPSGKGVGAWPTGTFQAYLKNITGNKTINFQPGDVARAIIVNKLVDTNGDGVVDLVGGMNDDPLLAGYTIVLCNDGVVPGDASCTTATTTSTGQVTFYRLAGNYDIYETGLPTGYSFVTWSGSCTNAGTNQKGDLTLGTAAVTCSVTNSRDTGSLKITKTVDAGGSGFTTGSFGVSAACTSDPNSPYARTIDTAVSSDVTIAGIPANSICTVTETSKPAAPTGYSWDPETITPSSVTIGSGTTVEVGVANKLTLIPVPRLTITKVTTEASYNAVGQVIHYTIVATNDGNVPLAAVTVSDPLATSPARRPTVLPWLPARAWPVLGRTR